VKRSLPQPLVIGLIVAGFLLAALGGYFFLLKPQRAKAADLSAQIEDTRAAIVSARALTLQGRPKIRVADLFRLTKAMPDQTDMAGIILELNQVAEDSGISFEEIAPATIAVPIAGYEALPITLDFQGNFYELADFLYRLRNLVDVRHGTLAATGRLFAVDTIDFAEGEGGFPQVSAHIVVDAFVFGTGTVPTVEPAPAAGSGPTGASGATGTTGPSGATGATGASGPAPTDSTTTTADTGT
jgi:Pilus assembly protein, PilO